MRQLLWFPGDAATQIRDLARVAMRWIMSESNAEKQSQSEALGQINRYHLLFAGYSAAAIVGLGDLSRLERDRMDDLIRTKVMEEAAKGFDKAGVRTKPFHEDEKKQ